ncbi:MAG: Dabb family protein [Bacteroidota bacterium]
MKWSLLIFCIFIIGCNHSEKDYHTNKESNYNPAIQANEITVEKPSLVHNVYFWYKEDVDKQRKKAFITALQELGTVKSIHSYYYGGSASTEARGVVDHSYDMAINVFFKDVAAHDAYQVDPIHLKFVEEFKDIWEKVIVYDNTLN